MFNKIQVVDKNKMKQVIISFFCWLLDTEIEKNKRKKKIVIKKLKRDSRRWSPIFFCGRDFETCLSAFESRENRRVQVGGQAIRFVGSYCGGDRNKKKKILLKDDKKKQ